MIQEIHAASEDGKGKWSKILKPDPAMRRILVCAVGVAFFQQAIGIGMVRFPGIGQHRRCGMMPDVQ